MIFRLNISIKFLFRIVTEVTRKSIFNSRREIKTRLSLIIVPNRCIVNAVAEAKLNEDARSKRI